MITEKNNVFYCDCGFSFQRGHSGAHDCADGLRNKLADSEARCAALAAENAGLKAAHPQPFGPEMMKALDAYEKHQDETPETGMLDAFFILRDSIRVDTTATDAFLAEVRASAVEELMEKSLCDTANCLHGIGAFDKANDRREVQGIIHEELRERVVDFAAQIRKGVQS